MCIYPSNNALMNSVFYTYTKKSTKYSKLLKIHAILKLIKKPNKQEHKSLKTCVTRYQQINPKNIAPQGRCTQSNQGILFIYILWYIDFNKDSTNECFWVVLG